MEFTAKQQDDLKQIHIMKLASYLKKKIAEQTQLSLEREQRREAGTL